MSRRKHVALQALNDDVAPPGENQSIVEFADGKKTLCLIPAKFHKKLWIKNGNFLIAEQQEQVDGAVTGQIVAVLFAHHVRSMQKMPGVWPEAFREPEEEERVEEGEGDSEAEGGSSSEDGLPPLEQIQNRRVIEYSDDETDSD
ncbi:hypothetical protein H632_c791p1 [Helicosporidium sp. ATCC 50920]|nr:hypothetical protein H632_c791p1 [Helicosporidium sp. ATCC 50920]|eukprot:KDD75238.1 hypothetical protein H632_c791p1 [Helicosporidium sp. ATCC 50920]